jgi:peptide deformylase
MAERRAIKWGNPLLTRVAEPVTQFGTEQLQLLVTDLWDTMTARGGTGLAAPQIGESYRIEEELSLAGKLDQVSPC